MKTYRVQYGYRVVGYVEIEAKNKQDALDSFSSSHDDFGTDEECGFTSPIKAEEIK